MHIFARCVLSCKKNDIVVPSWKSTSTCHSRHCLDSFSYSTHTFTTSISFLLLLVLYHVKCQVKLCYVWVIKIKRVMKNCIISKLALSSSLRVLLFPKNNEIKLQKMCTTHYIKPGWPDSRWWQKKLIFKLLNNTERRHRHSRQKMKRDDAAEAEELTFDTLLFFIFSLI